MMLNKICKKHGILNQEDIQIEKITWKTKEGKKTGDQLRCRICRREKDMKWKHDHREQHIASSQRWREENKEHYNEWLKNDRLKNPEKYRKWSKAQRERLGKLKSLRDSLSKYNITQDEYEKILEKQNGTCAICHKVETRKSRTEGDICRLAIDHCHETGIVRGLLCHACNIMIGKADDSVKILLSAIEYLQVFET